MVGRYHKHLYRFLCDNYISLKKYYDPDHPDPAAADVLTLDYSVRQEQDYSNPHIQELYVLRYTYSYAYEYREMFLRFITAGRIPIYWDVLSLGCGNGIDYWAIREAQSLREPTPAHIRYTGVDLIKWNNRWGEDYLSINADVHYEEADVLDYLQSHPVLSQNIIVFPKSISEFPEDVFEKICNAFASAKFQFAGRNGDLKDIDQVHFLVSLRTKGNIDPNELMDKKRSDRLIEAMEKNGFVLKNGAEIVTESEKNIHIYDKETDFNYPNEAWAYMGELRKREISISPMTYTKYICNRIMSFKRKEQS